MKKKCKDLVREAFNSRMSTIRTLYEAENQETDELGDLAEYGLAIDYVEPGTFTDQTQGYKRYQLSWGGPSEEFRLFDDGTMQFWYMDWFDGASVPVTGDDYFIIKDIISYAI